jgi:hypothetical protein
MNEWENNLRENKHSLSWENNMINKIDYLLEFLFIHLYYFCITFWTEYENEYLVRFERWIV